MFEKTKGTLYGGTYPTWNGYTVPAADGSKIRLPCDKAVLAAFGEMGGQAMAQVSVLYDVLNTNIAEAEITGVRKGEDGRTLLIKHIENHQRFASIHPFQVADRGYPSYEVLKKCVNSGVSFVFRLPKGFNKNIDKAADGDNKITIKLYKKPDTEITVRVLKFVLGRENTGAYHPGPA